MIPDMVMDEASKFAGTWPVWMSSHARGRKYILATQCSNPAAMKAETGSTIATILSVTDRPAVGEPDRRAHEHVAQDPLDEQRHYIGTDFAARCIQHRKADAAIIHVEMMGQEHKNNQPERSKQITEPDDGPVAEHRPRGNRAAGPGH